MEGITADPTACLCPEFELVDRDHRVGHMASAWPARPRQRAAAAEVVPNSLREVKKDDRELLVLPLRNW